jgi:hypothetical protein
VPIASQKKNERGAVGAMRIGRGKEEHGEYFAQFQFFLGSKPEARGGAPVLILFFM